jgi:hypothetical protein
VESITLQMTSWAARARADALRSQFVAFVGWPRFAVDAVAAVRERDEVRVAGVDGCVVVRPYRSAMNC